jgi:hypothetical protein
MIGRKKNAVSDSLEICSDRIFQTCYEEERLPRLKSASVRSFLGFGEPADQIDFDVFFNGHLTPANPKKCVEKTV